MARLDGKVAIITGAAGYIGAATARLFAAEGCKLVCADIDGTKLDNLVDDIRSNGGDAVPCITDVTNEDAVAAMVDYAVAKYGRLDILHNNATAASGKGPDSNVVETPDAEWDWALKINLYSTIWGCRHAIPKMLETGGGSIINMASMLHRLGNSNMIAIGVAKAAIVALTKYTAASHGKQGIRANVIAPGFAMSPDRVEKLPEALMDIHRMHAMTPELGGAQDMAYSALYLASDESRFVTGQVMEVDGGLGALSPTMPASTNMDLAIGTFVKR